MMNKIGKRVKHIPHRTCVACRDVLAKRELLRLVRTDQGILIDPSGKVEGRGAYLHASRSCWENGLKGSLAHALKTILTDEDKQRLIEFMKSLPKENEKANETSI